MSFYALWCISQYLIFLIIEKCQEHLESGWKRAKTWKFTFNLQSLTAQEKTEYVQVLSVENICRREKKNKQSKNLLPIDSHVYKCVGTCVCVRQREDIFSQIKEHLLAFIVITWVMFYDLKTVCNHKHKCLEKMEDAYRDDKHAWANFSIYSVFPILIIILE